MVKLSVIIPTHRRPDILAECLRRLEQQTIAADIEVIVVDDAQDEMTAKVVHHQQSANIRLLPIAPCQQGVARNKGVLEARGQYALFIGDDIFLEPDACEKHMKVYSDKPLAISHKPHAVLGFTTWDPAVGITPVMQWLETSGWQFGYPMIARYAHGVLPTEIQHRFTYTSHISLPTEIAKTFPFRTDVHLYGWEDIEWGMRLKNAGVRLVYEPDAKALHHHHITLEDSLKRMEILGRSAVEIQKKVPEFDRVPKGWKLWVYKIAALLPTMAGRHRKAFLCGLRSSK